MTQSLLELFLVTYNRKEKCNQTLQAILGNNSPVKNLPLTILDNCSTDGTSEMLMEVAARHPNVKHIRHNKNIGGNANIARAFEMATAQYVWVLCDDDKYDFSSWNECEDALKQNPPAVVVVKYAHPEKGPQYLFRQLSFVPAAIYRTDLITSTVLINMYFNVSNMFPQLAIAAAALNANKSLPILSKPLVTMQLNPGHDSYIRGTKSTEKIHSLMQEMFWAKGYLSSLGLLTDSHLSAQCCFLANSQGECFYNYCGRFMEEGLKTGNGLLYTYFMGIHLQAGWVKFLFAACVIPAFICSFIVDEKGINIRLFGRIKTRIWKYYRPRG